MPEGLQAIGSGHAVVKFQAADIHAIDDIRFDTKEGVHDGIGKVTADTQGSRCGRHRFRPWDAGAHGHLVVAMALA